MNDDKMNHDIKDEIIEDNPINDISRTYEKMKDDMIKNDKRCNKI
jgi:hypothetical protein